MGCSGGKGQAQRSIYPTSGRQPDLRNPSDITYDGQNIIKCMILMIFFFQVLCNP